MTVPKGFAVVVVACTLCAAGPGGPELPLIDGAPTLVVINEEPITLDEFYAELASRHRGVRDTGVRVPRQDPDAVLEKMINVRLILQEARNIGFDRQADVAEAVAAFGRDALHDLLLERHVREIADPPPDEVQRRYREAVGQVRMATITLEREDVAREARESLASGVAFQTLAAELVAAGIARGGDPSPFIGTRDLLPQVRDALWALEPGAVSDVLPVGRSFALVRLLERRIPDDPAVRERVHDEALQAARVAAVLEYGETLRIRHTRVLEDVLEDVDYTEQGPGFDAYLEDRRTVAEIDGDAPLTVSELTRKVKSTFFHGVERAMAKGRTERTKLQVLDTLLRRRAILREAVLLEIDRTPAYRERVAAFENRVLFERFVSRVIEPELEASDDELQAHLERHAERFSSPDRVRLESLAFSRGEDAEAALGRLRRGAEFAWVRANAGGQTEVVGDDALVLDGELRARADLPESLQQVLSGAAAGEYRLWPEAPGRTHVVHVRELVPPLPLPLDSVRRAVRNRVLAVKRLQALDEWAARLREASEIRRFVTDGALGEVLGLERPPE